MSENNFAAQITTKKWPFNIRLLALEADLWWGSSACRAEPAESSSVGTPEQKDNLQTQSNLSVISHPFDIE